MRAQRITIWENRRRVEFLVSFRNEVVRYFNNVRHTSYARLGDAEEMPEAREARTQLNQTLTEATAYLRDAGVAQVVTWTPPPMIGGHSRNIHLLQNLFNLHRFEVSPQLAIDAIEQAIGVYESDRSAASKRTFNPFFWLGCGIRKISSLPFSILEHAGLHGRKLEDSLGGRILKLATEIIALGTAAFGFLKLIGKEHLLTDLLK